MYKPLCLRLQKLYTSTTQKTEMISTTYRNLSDKRKRQNEHFYFYVIPTHLQDKRE